MASVKRHSFYLYNMSSDILKTYCIYRRCLHFMGSYLQRGISNIVLCICCFQPGNEDNLFCFKYSYSRQLKDNSVM